MPFLYQIEGESRLAIRRQSGAPWDERLVEGSFIAEMEVPEVIAAQVDAVLRWHRITDGVLERSNDEGQSWQAVQILEVVVPVPVKVTRTQAKLALLSAGLFEAVETYVMAAAQQDAEGIRFRLVWDANDWYRASPELNYLADQMGMTTAEVDDLFRLAATK